jgi:cytidine deaminase
MMSAKDAAIAVRLKAHAPFSNFLVGAALETNDGQVFTGCNVENSSYGLTMCAERVAAFSAIAAGIQPRAFARLAVCGAPRGAASAELTPPCGACRQVLWDLCGNIPITLVGLDGSSETVYLADLLPRAFDATHLLTSPPQS